MFDESGKCAADQLPRCEAMQIFRLINTQLEAACFRLDSMFRDYQCMLDTYRDNPKCLDPLRGIVEEGQDVCTGQQESFDCFSKALSCNQGALTLVREIVRGHGCRIDLKRWLTKSPTTTATVFTTTTVSTDIEQPDNSTEATVTPKVENQARNKTDLATSPTFEGLTPQPSTIRITTTTTSAPWFGTCSPKNRNKARMCMAPLLRMWDGLRSRRLQLRKSQFPLYRYTKTELLELCDGYANSFLCAGHETIRYCLNDELVSFAQGHLGYQCSPQNLRRFLTHYDCLIEVEETSDCREMVKGEAIPNSKLQLTCEDMRKYAECMAHLVKNECNEEGLVEFKRTVEQFGCKNVFKN